MADKLRLLPLAPLVALAATGCGFGSSSSGSAVPCVSVPIVGSDNHVLAPPLPRIVRAVQRGQEMIVDVDVPATPSACKPVAYIVSVVSAVDYSNRSVQPGNNTGGYMPLHGRHLRVVLRPPVLRLPPYFALAAIAAKNGVPSGTVKRALPQKGDYCLRHHPQTLCEIRAHYDALRCMRADVPAAGCTAWTYGSMRPRPVAPVTDASPAAVQENLREVLASATYNDVRIEKLICSQTLVCIATFARSPAEGIVRVRYVLTGYRQKPGCWLTSRTDVLYPPPNRAESPLQAFVPLNNQGWCLSWRKP